MNPERWSEITKSFELTGVGTLANVSTVEKAAVSGGRTNEVLHSKSHYGHSTEHPRDLKDCTHGNLADADEAPGKIIENLCKIVKDKTEKIKSQAQVIDSLNERLCCEKSENSSSTQLDTKVITSSTTNGESIAEKVKSIDSCTDAAAYLKEIAFKIENLERRLTTVINFIQRKFPTEYSSSPSSSADSYMKKRNKQCTSWDKPPVLYPKPTYGSFIREIHCKSRTKNHQNSMSNALDNELSTQPQFQRNVKCVFPKVRREEEMEMRIQALEGLVVVLKNKMMKKIKSRRK